MNADGKTDVLSGSWPGELFAFYRKSDGSFTAREELKDKNGKSLNVGSASHLHAADWDRDGDLDLLVGNISGEVYLILNSGTKEKPVFETAEKMKADGKAIMAKNGDAGPAVVDWNGDGKLDLLLGTGSGAVYWYRNRGTRQKPILASAQVLIPAQVLVSAQPGSEEKQTKGKTPPCKGMTKVCVVDWNGDGRLDILLGDDASLTITREFTAEEKQKKKKADQKRKEIEKKDQALDKKLEDKKLSAEDRKKIEKEQENLAKELRTVLQVLARYEPTSEYHGRVWLFLQKGGERIASGK